MRYAIIYLIVVRCFCNCSFGQNCIKNILLPTDSCEITYKGEKIYENADEEHKSGKTYFLKSEFYPVYNSSRIFITKTINYPYFLGNEIDEDMRKDLSFIIFEKNNCKYFQVGKSDSIEISKLIQKQISETIFLNKIVNNCFFNTMINHDSTFKIKDEENDVIGVGFITKKSDSLFYLKIKGDRDGNQYELKSHYGITKFSYWESGGNSYHIDYSILKVFKL